MQITWFIDSANAVSIVHFGSKVPELQDLALRIFHVCLTFGISLEFSFVTPCFSLFCHCLLACC